MSALAHTQKSSIDVSDVTQISANARVDYILRFSKHAVLVVDQESKHYSLVGSQYLSALPESQNAAFISVSAKLNNIQIRCRIVEQLFGTNLFDPEQSLAVTIINLAQKNTDEISIVVEHAQFLSLQVMHELCQLAEIAKKTNLNINVLLLGTTAAGGIAASNMVLFDKKLSILSAQSGQLIAANSKIFKEPHAFFHLTLGKKILLAIVIFSLIVSSILVTLYQRDVLSFSSLPALDMTTSAMLVEQTNTLANKTVIDSERTKNKAQDNTTASVADVYASLMGPLSLNQDMPLSDNQLLTGPASPADILSAISPFAVNNKANGEQTIVIKPIEENVSLIELSGQPKVVKENAPAVNEEKNGLAFYQINPNGFIVQYAGISQQNVLTAFINENADLEYHQYQRTLGNETLTVLTSEIFANRKQAEEKIASLSPAMLEREPWVKPVSMVINEINAFQGSH